MLIFRISTICFVQTKQIGLLKKGNALYNVNIAS
ncbi:hypothetical protein KL86CLO1_10866 [uncultured Eubacteriales bacterium]|uniref:Uncharacterized protein n=1 Tax=uncultured Eubacteriales bacterium TaxID=172733 RepID=A0A212JCC8_9FIRM|nr:hypothetical protein KL86CLO1_10866 [uncultured Eubacteriales bacterium]